VRQRHSDARPAARTALASEALERHEQALLDHGRDARTVVLRLVPGGARARPPRDDDARGHQRAGDARQRPLAEIGLAAEPRIEAPAA
jgi:hypothetical protein